jgi:hypothetical protein
MWIHRSETASILMHDDFLTVTKEMAQQMARKQEEQFEEWAGFLKILLDDDRLAKQGCARHPTVQFLKRIQVRNFCALVEAQIHVWDLLTREWHEALRTELNPGERAILYEQAYVVNKESV